MEDIKLVGGYIRVSTVEQSQKGLSLETQEEEIKAYCKRMKYKLVKLYIDRGITARKNLYKRVSFMEMMQDVSCHKINHIVVLRLDRFFRNVYDYHRMMNEFLIPNNCGWSAVREDYDTTTTNGRLMINLRLSIAEQECDQDGDRIRDIFSNRIREGYVVTGKQPFGMEIKDHRLVPGEKAYMVQEVFREYLSTYSARKTLVNINNRYGTNFDYNWLLRILKQSKYTGVYRDNPNYCKAIISKEDFDRVQQEIKRNAKVPKTKRTYIFASMLRCGRCGHALTSNTSTSHPNCHYYRCRNHSLNARCDNKSYIREDYLEKYLVDNVERLLQDYIITIEAKEKQPEIKSNRPIIETKINRLNELFINGIIDLEELKTKRKELESQIIEPEKKPSKDLSELTKFLNSGFTNIYYDLTLEERRTLWRSVVKSMVVTDKVEEVSFL